MNKEKIKQTKNKLSYDVVKKTVNILKKKSKSTWVSMQNMLPIDYIRITQKKANRKKIKSNPNNFNVEK